MRNFWRLWMASGLIFILGVPLGVKAAQESRDDALAGEAEKIDSPKVGFEFNEPERGEAATAQDRPTLRMPEVVVQGGKQTEVISQRRDFSLLDPMAETVEIGADLKKQAAPGLDENKNIPLPTTVTSRPYILEYRGLLGNADYRDARLLAGWESWGLTSLLKVEYDALNLPEAWNLPRSRKNFSGRLNLGGEWDTPGVVLQAGAEAAQGQRRQRTDTPGGWGEYLTHNLYRFDWNGLWEQIWPHGTLQASGYFGRFHQSGNFVSPAWRESDFSKFQLDLKQALPTILGNEFSFACRADWRREQNQIRAAWLPGGEQNRRDLFSIRGGFKGRWDSFLSWELGIINEDLGGTVEQAESGIQAQCAAELPWNSIVYARADSGFDYRPGYETYVEEISQALFIHAPVPYTVSKISAGWRQTWPAGFRTHLAGVKISQEGGLLWEDPDHDGLWAVADLPRTETHEFMFEAGWDWDSYHLSCRYLYQDAQNSAGRSVPFIPQHSLESVLEWKPATSSWAAALTYRYLGERPASLEPAPVMLASVHLLSANASWRYTSFLQFIAAFDNMLGTVWEKWPGYPAPGRLIRFGAKLNF